MTNKLLQLLQQKKSAIVDRWLEGVLLSYSADAKSFYRREKNPFANPVGHKLASSLQSIFDGLLEKHSAEKFCQYLEEILKVRAIQDFSPSQALSFVVSLKSIVRKEYQKEFGNDLDKLGWELLDFELQIDQLALFAFDIFVKCREKVYELRVNEVKRQVSTLIKQINRFGPEAGTVAEPAKAETIQERGGGQ